MPRTRNRPMAAARMTVIEAWVFASLLGTAGVLYLTLLVNPLTAALGMFTLLTYVMIYTPMKRTSPWCTLVGAVPGAIPPVMGVTALHGSLTPLAWSLFLILFIWQLPHFFALALMYHRDYAAGGFRMFPLERDGDRKTRQQIILFAAALLPVGLTPVMVSNAGWLYGLGAAAMSLWFLRAAIACAQRLPGAEKRLFLVSIAYLPLLLAILMVDQ
jgi:protoheme IX farnesyltransferase